MRLTILDIIILIVYIALVVFLGNWLSRGKKGESKTSKDYFLAGNTLPWWAIGSSLIASNISAEQFIGMSGSGFALGLAIATYEWMAAATLLVVAKFFLPIFLEKKIYTMPQFLEMRYDGRVRTSMAIFWILLYIFVNLTAVIYLGALSIKTIMGVDFYVAVYSLAAFSLLYSLYGGLTAVAWTDVIQVIFLIFGGLITTFLALNAISDGKGIWVGFYEVYQKAPEHFSMIIQKGEIMLKESNGNVKDAYMDLPGIGVLIGGMWIANLNYWGCNQYITQRALAAKNLAEAQRGLVFAGFLKLIIPLIVVIPGIVAFVMKAPIVRPDEAYPWLMDQFVGPGFKGLAFAALIAAIVSSLSSMANSTSTIFTIDLYKHYLDKNASEEKQVLVGRITAVVAVLIATLIAPLLSTLDQAFQFIQEFTGFISPAIVAVFIMGLFYRKSSATAALVAVILAVPLSWLFKVYFIWMPFLDRMGYVFLILCAVIALLSISNKDESKAIEISAKTLRSDPVFNIFALILIFSLVFLYIVFW